MTNHYCHIRQTPQCIKLIFSLPPLKFTLLRKNFDETVDRAIERVNLLIKRKNVDCKIQLQPSSPLTWNSLFALAQNNIPTLHITSAALFPPSIPLTLNPPYVENLTVHPMPLIGCPLPLKFDLHFADPSRLRVAWFLSEKEVLDVDESMELSREWIYTPKQPEVGKHLWVKAWVDGVCEDSSGSMKAVGFVGALKQCGWWSERIFDFLSQPRCGYYNNNEKTISEDTNDNIHHISDQDVSVDRANYQFKFPLLIASFNVLAPIYTRSQYSKDHLYPNCRDEYLNEHRRAALIGREIFTLNPDVLALQEASIGMFERFFEPLLSRTHHLLYTQKLSNAREGCLLAVKKDRFNLIHTEAFAFRTLLLENRNYSSIRAYLETLWPGFSDSVKRLSTIFQFAVVRENHDECESKVLVMGNTHLYFHGRASHIRTIQAYIYYCEALRIKSQYEKVGHKVSVSLCGDLNSLPESAVVRFLSGETITPTDPDYVNALDFHIRSDREDEGETPSLSLSTVAVPSSSSSSSSSSSFSSSSNEKIKGPELKPGELELSSLYGKKTLSCPDTHRINGFKACLDYIFVSKELKHQKALKGFEANIEVKELPNEDYPSDHIIVSLQI